MRGDNWFIYFIVAVVIAHFLFGIGWLLYKIMRAGKSKDSENK